MTSPSGQSSTVKSSNTRSDKPLIVISMLSILLIAIAISTMPDVTNQWASTIFNGITSYLGAIIQAIVLAGFVFIVYIAISKYGNIRLGDQEPEYKTLPWIFMFICAGMGASALYWGIIEWSYYYQGPGLSLEPNSTKAMEMSVPFSFFHWGVGAWGTYAVASVIMAYHFHVRKNKGLALSSIISAIFKVRTDGAVGRIVDLIFLNASVGALTLSLVISVATLTNGLSFLIGTPNNFTVQAIVTIGAATIFALSAYIGIGKGMQLLSSIVGYGSLILAFVVLVLGPTQFIVNNITSSIGLTLQNYFQMSLYTEPFGTGDFTRSWTVFYWLWWISYTPGMAMFVTRVSAGRKIKELIWALIIGSTSGCWFYFGVLESYSIHEFISGGVNTVEIVNSLGGDAAIAQLLDKLPLGTLLLAVFLFLMVIMLASHMDAVAYAMAATATRNLGEGEDPSRAMKLFWCVILTLIPLAILYTDAPLSTVKTSAVMTGIPFLAIMLITFVGFLKWLFNDYGHVPAHTIDTYVLKVEAHDEEQNFAVGSRVDARAEAAQAKALEKARKEARKEEVKDDKTPII